MSTPPCYEPEHSRPLSSGTDKKTADDVRRFKYSGVISCVRLVMDGCNIVFFNLSLSYQG